ncbi:MAG TPA: energy transducer TonB [Buttiauxella sp.]|jgi:protein TonB
MMSFMEGAPAPGRPVLRWFGWGNFSVLLHAGLLVILIWRSAADLPDDAMPSAVMLTWSDSIEAPSTIQLVPVGQMQIAAAAAEKKEAFDEALPQPKRIEIEKAEIKIKQRVSERSRKNERQKKKTQEQRASKASESSVANRAAAQSPQPVSERVAAPFNSDGRMQKKQVSWESLVLGHMNRFKRYPTDARERRRTGVVMLNFIVSAEGRILQSRVINSSGTISLDREASAMLSRAEPLPKPPADILINNQFEVNIPVVFNLDDLKRI